MVSNAQVLTMADDRHFLAHAGRLARQARIGMRYFNGCRLVILSYLIVLWINAVTCNSSETRKLPEIIHPNGKHFAGSESCERCHKRIAETHQLTAHYLTSRPANVKTIKGSFDAGKN